MNEYLTELIGTFLLLLTIGCAVIGGAAGVMPPPAIGSAAAPVFTSLNPGDR